MPVLVAANHVEGMRAKQLIEYSPKNLIVAAGKQNHSLRRRSATMGSPTEQTVL